jgi:hypothetical protein
VCERGCGEKGDLPGVPAAAASGIVVLLLILVVVVRASNLSRHHRLLHAQSLVLFGGREAGRLPCRMEQNTAEAWGCCEALSRLSPPHGPVHARAEGYLYHGQKGHGFQLHRLQGQDFLNSSDRRVVGAKFYVLLDRYGRRYLRHLGNDLHANLVPDNTTQ